MIKVVDSPGAGGAEDTAGKALIVEAIGAPATPQDTLTQLAGHVTGANSDIRALLIEREVPNVTQTQLTSLVARLPEIPKGREILWLSAGATINVLSVPSGNNVQNTSGMAEVAGSRFRVNGSGSIRINMSIQTGQSGGTIYARVYRNGVGVGISRSATATSAQVFTEDFTMNEGDIFSVYAYVVNYTGRLSLVSVSFGSPDSITILG